MIVAFGCCCCLYAVRSVVNFDVDNVVDFDVVDFDVQNVVDFNVGVVGTASSTD